MDVQFTVQDFSVDNNTGYIWVHAFPYRSYKHPKFGEVTFDRSAAEELKQNFDNNVLEREIAWNYAHRKDLAKGEKASGWARQVEVRDDGAWVAIEPTATAYDEITKGEWKYSSIERLPEYTHEATGKTYKNVLSGGALTNYPFMKGIAPLNFSDFDNSNEEGSEVDLKELANKVGLGEDASEEQVFERLQNFSDTHSAVESGEYVKKASPPKPEDSKVDEQTFSELPPEVKAELEANRKFRQKHEAQEFAENLITEDGKRLSPSYIEKVAQAKIKNDSGEMTMQEFAQVMVEATQKGVVQLGEIGSAQQGTTEQDDRDNKVKAHEFADKVYALAKDEDNPMSFGDATAKLQRDEPELYSAYVADQAGGVS